jgi:hypothetical protein
LIFIRVGEDPASRVYVGMKEKKSKELGIDSKTLVLEEQTTQDQLLDIISQYNADLSFTAFWFRHHSLSTSMKRLFIQPFHLRKTWMDFIRECRETHVESAGGIHAMHTCWCS